MRALLSSTVVVLTLCNSYSARADEVTLVAPGGVRAATKAPEAARALLSYLSSPEAAAVYKACGMQPGR
jgi:hypothetical protein